MGTGCTNGLDTDQDGSSVSKKWGCAHLVFPLFCLGGGGGRNIKRACDQAVKNHIQPLICST